MAISRDIEPAQFVSWGIEQWRRLKDEKLEFEDQMRECWLAANSRFGRSWDSVKKYRSRRYLPLASAARGAVKAQLIQGCMPHDKWFTVEGRTPGDDSSAKYMTALMRWQHERMGFRAEMAKAIDMAVVFGIVPWCVDWAEDFRFVPDQQQYSYNLGEHAANVEGMQPGQEMPLPPEMVYKKKRQYDGPKFRVGNPFDFVIERSRDRDENSLMVVRTFSDIAKLKHLAEPNPVTKYAVYENLDAIANEMMDRETSDSIQREVEGRMGFYNASKDAVELLSFYGDFVIKGTVYNNHVAVIANRTALIRFEPSPYEHGRRAWQFFVTKPDPIEAYGKGYLNDGLGLIDAANVRFNQVLDANTLVVNPAWEVVQDGIIDTDGFISAPGAVNLVRSPGTIRPLNVPDHSNTGMQEISFLMGQFNELTGSMRAISMPGDAPSAAQANASKAQMDSQFAEMIRHIENTMLIPALTMQMELNQQLMDEDVWVRLVEPNPMPDPMTGQPPAMQPVGPARMKVSRDEILGDFDLVCVGASWLQKQQQEQGEMIQKTQMISQTPAVNIIKWDEYARELYSDLPDAWKFIKTQQEIAFEQQQQQLAMQQQQQMAQQGGQGQNAGPQNQQGNRGTQSVPGSQSPPPGGGAANGPVRQTVGGAQRTGF